MKRLLLLLLATGAALVVGTAMAEDRASIEARFAAERQACQQHFAVNNCVDAARRREQEALAPVIAKERAQAAEDRRRRSEVQAEQRRVRDLQSAREEAQRRERLLVSPAPRPLTPAAAASASPLGPMPPMPVPASSAPTSAELKKAQARVAAQEAREREAEARVRQHAEREARRRAPGARPVAPLLKASAPAGQNP